MYNFGHASLTAWNSRDEARKHCLYVPYTTHTHNCCSSWQASADHKSDVRAYPNRRSNRRPCVLILSTQVVVHEQSREFERIVSLRVHRFFVGEQWSYNDAVECAGKRRHTSPGTDWAFFAAEKRPFPTTTAPFAVAPTALNVANATSLALYTDNRHILAENT